MNEQLRHHLTYLIREKHKDEDKQALVLVEKGRVKGYAEDISFKTKLDNLEELKTRIQAVYDEQDLSWIVDSFHKSANQERHHLL